jgi:hypothetical protein
LLLCLLPLHLACLLCHPFCIIHPSTLHACTLSYIPMPPKNPAAQLCAAVWLHPHTHLLVAPGAHTGACHHRCSCRRCCGSGMIPFQWTFWTLPQPPRRPPFTTIINAAVRRCCCCCCCCCILFALHHV